MKRKILVAGAGHGGIAAAARLAENGFEVTVVEKHARNEMGYDWTDIFDRRSLELAEIPMPSEDKYEIKGDVTFYGPSENTSFIQFSPDDQQEIKMERKEIYNHLISHAQQCGVNFEFSVTVLEAIADGKRIVGVKTDKGDYYADLVIDACGCSSPVRRSLPDCLGIQKNTGADDIFYVYRAFYNKQETEEVPDDFKLILLSQGITGISWVMVHENAADMLIGRFKPFGMDEVESAAEHLREKNKVLGKELIRGGAFAQIPVRQPLAVLVADGYAAVGDSAFMPVPLIGSGIATSLAAARYLSDAVIENKDGELSANELWDYQKKFYSSFGKWMAPIACVKNMILNLSAEQVDDVFDRGMLEYLAEQRSREQINTMQVLMRLKNVVHDKDFSSQIKKSLKNMIKVEKTISNMPEQYDWNSVMLWAQKYNKLFK